MTGGFDRHDAGTAEPAWRELLAGLPRLDPPGRGDRVVVVSAHPDDETLGVGGLLAQAAAAGARMTVLVASNGEASHPRSPTHSPADLASRRRDEVARALALLAPDADLRLLDLPDGRLAEHEAQLTSAVDAAADGATHLLTTWVGDRHPDHAACARAGAAVAARRGLAHWQYPIWAWHWAAPDGDDLPIGRLRAVPVPAPVSPVKQAALACFTSQYLPLSERPGDEPVLEEATLAHFRRSCEIVVVAEETVSPSWFARLYAGSADPWGLADRFYEQRKRAVLLAALTRPRFRRAFEPGCALGLLTAELAVRCDTVVAWDVADAAVAAARERAPGAQVERGAIPDEWPAGEFDLIVLSEVGYYCVDLERLVDRVDASLAADGVLVACHWRRTAAAHPQPAEDVHAALGRGRTPVVEHVEADFLLHVWTADGRSVAQAEGIVA